MSQTVKTKIGEDYLPEHSIEDLKYMASKLQHGKPKLRVQAAILRKEGYKISKISDVLGVCYSQDRK